MASDFRLKDQLPELTERIVRHLQRGGHDQPPRPLPAAELRRDHRGLRGPEGDPLSRAIAAAKGCICGNVTYHVGDLIDRLHDKLTHADRPRPAARRRRRPTCAPTIATTKPSARPRRSSSSSSCPSCARCSRPTCRPPTTATRPCKNARRSDLLLSGPRGDHGLSPRPRAARAGDSVHPADDDRMGPLAAPASTSIPARRSASTSSSTTAPAS